MPASETAVSVGQKRSVLMVCAHDPGADPRIKWEAHYASAEFDVTVLGFAGDVPMPVSRDGPQACRTIRLQRSEMFGVRFFLLWLAALPAVARLAGMILAVVLLPLLALVEITIHASRWTARSMARVFSRRAASEPVAAPQAISGDRSRAIFRIAYIVALLRIQFAPAAVLFWRHIRQERVRPDVVHCNDLDTLLVGVLAKRKLGSTLVYDAHEFFPVSDPYGRWIDIAFFRLIERLMICKADAVIAVNPMLGDVMKESYGLREVHVLPNAEPWTGKHAVSLESNMSKLAGNRVKFLFQGRFSPERGIEELVTGWVRVDRSKAALFLRGPDNAWRRNILKLAERLGLLNSAVYFLDPVKEDMLVGAAAEADVGVIPYKPVAINDRFSCPNKLSQYLHAGLMIITNDLPYVKSVVEQAQAGLFYRSDDISSLVSAVDRVADDANLLRRCKANALWFARERFNWQAEMEVLHSLYRKVPDGSASDISSTCVESQAS